MAFVAITAFLWLRSPALLGEGHATKVKEADSLIGELLEDHIRNHLPQNSKSAEEAVEDVIVIVKTYLK